MNFLNFMLLYDRMKVENATLLESVATMEHLTSLVHRLHRVLMKVGHFSLIELLALAVICDTHFLCPNHFLSGI